MERVEIAMEEIFDFAISLGDPLPANTVRIWRRIDSLPAAIGEASLGLLRNLSGRSVLTASSPRQNLRPGEGRA